METIDSAIELIGKEPGYAMIICVLLIWIIVYYTDKALNHCDKRIE